MDRQPKQQRFEGIRFLKENRKPAKLRNVLILYSRKPKEPEFLAELRLFWFESA